MFRDNKVQTFWRVEDPKQQKNRKKQLLIASIVCGLLGSGIILANLPKLKEENATPTATVTEIEAVTALGRIQPKGEVIKLAPPPNLGGAKILNLLVEEGDLVTQGQVLALLDNNPLKKAALEVANKEVELQKSNLNIVKAGAKEGEIKAQEATIERLKAELNAEKARSEAEINRTKAELAGQKEALTATLEGLKAEYNNAELEFNRYQALAKDGAISTSELDQKRLTLDTAKEKMLEAEANLNKAIATLEENIKEAEATSQKEIESLTMQVKEAEATLAKIAEVRDVEVKEAQAQLDKAIAENKQAQEELALTEIRAPFAGRILKINARTGEGTNETEGVLEIGQTDQMMVIAEVYESDIAKIKLGQEAIITSEGGAFDSELKGKVEEIGWQIGKNEVLDNDPAADVDTRVVEVKILLDPESSKLVENLTYSQVFVEIKL
jgi:HlyD family secretion protein